MHFTDQGIVVSTRKFSENSIVARIFTPHNGVCAGVVRGATSKTMRGLYQPGNLVDATWSARLAEQLGSWKSEMVASYAAHIMQEASALTTLTSACALTETALPDREPHEELYSVFHTLVQALASGLHWPEAYARFEFELLVACGFQLDLSSCAATGTARNLMYVSPKSGRAVSREAGEPYADKLFPLPRLLLEGYEENIGAAEPPEILASLNITGYFLTRWLLEPHGWVMPAARARLLKHLEPKTLHAA